MLCIDQKSEDSYLQETFMPTFTEVYQVVSENMFEEKFIDDVDDRCQVSGLNRFFRLFSVWF